MRLFVALDLPDHIKDKIGTLVDTTLTGARWTKREQWHITLHFIGEVESDIAIRVALKIVQAQAFSLRLKSIGTFPEKRKPSVLWAGIDATSALQDLHQKIGDALKTTGFTPETRPYHPHMTLARFKYKTPSRREMADYLQKYKTFETETIEIADFALYQSELSPDAAIYTIIEKFSLDE